MIRYTAFLRGINISGKNKISMAELKLCSEELGFVNVKTYLNSGNLSFSCNRQDNQSISGQLERMIKERFCLTIPVYVIAADDLTDVLRHAPDWWGTEDKEVYDNLIFILKPATFKDVLDEIGPPKDGLEQIENYNDIVFWSFRRKDYQKTNWWSKTANAAIGSKLTIRTAGTVRKVCLL